LVARRYDVTVRTVERYWKRYVETAQVQPRQLGGYRVSKLAAHDESLLRWIRAQPDLTLVQLQQRCAEKLKVEISVNALWYRLDRLSLSFKKNDARRRTRPA
jgi:transposase